jgi:hypothetical protein
MEAGQPPASLRIAVTIEGSAPGATETVRLSEDALSGQAVLRSDMPLTARAGSS